jgi:hypothetical protein
VVLPVERPVINPVEGTMVAIATLLLAHTPPAEISYIDPVSDKHTLVTPVMAATDGNV